LLSLTRDVANTVFLGGLITYMINMMQQDRSSHTSHVNQIVVEKEMCANVQRGKIICDYVQLSTIDCGTRTSTEQY